MTRGQTSREERTGAAPHARSPRAVPNWIDGQPSPPASGASFVKVNPATGEDLSWVARSSPKDVGHAVRAACAATPAWAALPGVERGARLFDAVARLEERREVIIETVHAETGKSRRGAGEELDAVIAVGRFFAGEGQRSYGRTTTSATRGREAMTVREPVGVAGLIVAANMPIANVAWKVFPALVCGNTAVVKAAEDAPASAWLFAEALHAAGIPPGVLNVVHGYGPEAGEALVADARVGVISFTGSTSVGRRIASIAGDRLARVSLELGGKNAFVVWDDADLEDAVRWGLLSVFSNAGQRCASASRLIVADGIYEPFESLFLERARALRAGTEDEDDLGPLISARQLETVSRSVEGAIARGARVEIGGHRLTGDGHEAGFYFAPTVLSGVGAPDPLWRTELFGPVATLHRSTAFEEAVALVNDSPYGLTAAIHTRDVDRAWAFVRRVQTGVVVVNGGTFGSEPHMPFGGTKDSGNGTREPGTEALDVYSSLKNVYLHARPTQGGHLHG